MRSRLPWLATDEEFETEPEDLYSQGDRPDPHKDRWKRAVGGAVSGMRQLVPPQGPLAQEEDCCTEGIADHPRFCAYCGPRTLRVRNPADRAGASATIACATHSRPEDCDEPEIDHYASRDPWYPQS